MAGRYRKICPVVNFQSLVIVIKRPNNSMLGQRVIDHWNKLPQYIVDAPSTNSFKNRPNRLRVKCGSADRTTGKMRTVTADFFCGSNG